MLHPEAPIVTRPVNRCVVPAFRELPSITAHHMLQNHILKDTEAPVTNTAILMTTVRPLTAATTETAPGGAGPVCTARSGQLWTDMVTAQPGTIHIDPEEDPRH